MSCGTRVQDFHPGDPDGAGLLRSSLLINYSLTGTAYYWYCELLVASNSATLRQPAPSPVLQPLWLRNSTAAPSCELQLRTTARQFISAGPPLISTTTETLTTPQTNVYSSKYRFSRAVARSTPPRTVPSEGSSSRQALSGAHSDPPPRGMSGWA